MPLWESCRRASSAPAMLDRAKVKDENLSIERQNQKTRAGNTREGCAE
jgi:hypothetical protein